MHDYSRYFKEYHGISIIYIMDEYDKYAIFFFIGGGGGGYHGSIFVNAMVIYVVPY